MVQPNPPSILVLLPIRAQITKTYKPWHFNKPGPTLPIPGHVSVTLHCPWPNGGPESPTRSLAWSSLSRLGFCPRLCRWPPPFQLNGVQCFLGRVTGLRLSHLVVITKTPQPYICSLVQPASLPKLAREWKRPPSTSNMFENNNFYQADGPFPSSFQIGSFPDVKIRIVLALGNPQLLVSSPHRCKVCISQVIYYTRVLNCPGNLGLPRLWCARLFN